MTKGVGDNKFILIHEYSLYSHSSKFVRLVFVRLQVHVFVSTRESVDDAGKKIEHAYTALCCTLLTAFRLS
jgi:hypothetical protein